MVRRTGTYDKPQRMIRTIVHELVKLLDSKIKDHLSLVPIDAEPRPFILGLIDFELKELAMSAPSLPMDPTHGDAATINSTDTSTNSSSLECMVLSLEKLPRPDNNPRSTNFGRTITKSTLETSLRAPESTSNLVIPRTSEAVESFAVTSLAAIGR